MTEFRGLIELFLKVHDVFCLLGGIQSLSRHFPHLVTGRERRQVVIPWMPTLVRTDRLFLGRHEQAEEGSIVRGLQLTHVFSIGR